MKKKRRLLTWGTIVCLLLAVGLWIMLRVSRERQDALKRKTSVSESQIRRIGEATGEFAKEYSRRPGRLEMLVAGGYLRPMDLFDKRRSEVPAIDGETGRFTVNPDVLYFPALRPDDPGDLVMLCTILLPKEGGNYHVIFNDGGYAALTSRELIMAMNRTYEHTGGKVVTTAASRPKD